MHAAVFHGAGDVRIEAATDPMTWLVDDAIAPLAAGTAPGKMVVEVPG